MVTTRQTDSSVAVLAPTMPKTSMAKASASASQAKKRVVARPPVPRRVNRFAVKKINTKFTKKGGTDNETIEVVKMLTGTLYLYRGEHRRVEFVRKV